MSTQVSSAKTCTGPNFTKSQAIKLIENLNPEERRLFMTHLSKLDQSNIKNVPPTAHELRHLAFHNSIPFVGFGFLDNFIMILAGEYIDMRLGMSLGISTMAAAACGNTISDLCGIGSAWYVEMWASRLGAEPPSLSPSQMEMRSSKVAANLGRAVGVVVGCLIGMFPLLFIDTSGSSDEKKEIEEPTENKSA